MRNKRVMGRVPFRSPFTGQIGLVKPLNVVETSLGRFTLDEAKTIHEGLKDSQKK